MPPNRHIHVIHTVTHNVYELITDNDCI